MGRFEKMGVVSCADNSWRRRRPRPSSTGGQYYTFVRGVVDRQEGSRSRKKCGARRVPPVQGVEFHINLEELSFPSRRFASPCNCIYPARSVRNLITTPRAFSYYHSTEFRVTVRKNPFRPCSGIKCQRSSLRNFNTGYACNESLIVNV